MKQTNSLRRVGGQTRQKERMMKAKFIKNLDNFYGNAGLYELNPPMKYEKWDDDKEDYVSLETYFVAVSPANVIFSGPETYIFPCDQNGNVTSWGELDGSYRGGLNREKALNDAGYTVIE